MNLHRIFFGWLSILLALFCCHSKILFAEPLPDLPPDFSVGFYYPPIQNLVSRNDFEATLTVWIEEVTQKIKSIPIKIELFDSIEAMRKAFDQGELAMIVGPPFVLAKYFDRNSLAEGLTGTTPQGKPNGLIMLVRKNKQIDSIQQLRGKRLVMPTENELADVFLDTLTFKTYRQSFQKVFSSVRLLPSYSSLVYEVFFDRADVALTYQETYDVMLELNPQLSSTLTVLTGYPFIAPNYGYFHRRYPDNLRKMWIENAIRLDNSPKAKQVLLNLKMGGFTVCPVDALEPFDQLVENYSKVKHSGTKP